MTESPVQSPEQIATANVKQKSKGFSPVWIIPIIAVLVGGWMVFKNALDENTVIEVTFKDASGIEADKTVVKLRDVVIGKVTAVNFSKDLSNVKVMLMFKDVPADRFNEKTRFWVVRPRIGIGGVSGLGTLLSGPYIAVDPSDIKGGNPVTKFVGLEQPELYQLGNPGTSYKLKTDSLGSLSRESPVKYLDLEVGQVTRYELAKDNTAVDVDIFIRDPYDKLVKKDTRFWNISGLNVDVGDTGVKVNMASIATLISGGVAFSTSDLATGAQARAGSVFNLYKTETEDPFEAAEVLAFNVPLKLYFEKGVHGLVEGAQVEYKGLRIGTVAKISIEFDEANELLRTFAIVKIEPDRLPVDDTDYDNRTDAERTKAVHEFFERMADRGMRGQLKTGNLLTGRTLVEFDIFPDAKPAKVIYTDMAVFPTMPSSLANIIQKIDEAVTKTNSIMASIDAMPIAEIGNGLAEITASINAIPITEIGKDLAETTEIIKLLPYGETSKNLKDTLANIDSLVVSLNAAKGGVIGVQTREALTEIMKAASALRGLAAYLERHPEALLKGKRGN